MPFNAIVKHPRATAAPGNQRKPSLRGVPFQAFAGTGRIELLSEPQREQLAQMATVHHIPSRGIIYRAGAIANCLFIIDHGAVKSYRDLSSGKRRIAAFLFSHDLFGLAEAGHYVNTAQAMTPSTVYRLELSRLAEAFQQDSELELRFLCKAVHELRVAQHHTIMVTRRHATARLAMLLRMLERQMQQSPGAQGLEIPMTRSDVANYLGLSLEAVVRATRKLERQGIIDFRDRHHAIILDRQRFEALAATT